MKQKFIYVVSYFRNGYAFRAESSHPTQKEAEIFAKKEVRSFSAIFAGNYEVNVHKMKSAK